MVSFEDRLYKINSKLISREMQLHLLHKTINNDVLAKSKILSSILPKIGKVFVFRDLELKARKILLEARMKILKECSLPEAEREIAELGRQSFKILSKQSDTNDIEKNIRDKNEVLRKKIRASHSKKVEFHLQNVPPKLRPPKSPKKCAKRSKWRNMAKDRKRKQKKAYLERKRTKRDKRIKDKVKLIGESAVRNFSSLDIPDEAYLYLAKGLNFVENKTANKEDLKFDTKEFLRKLEWKAFFAQNPTDESFDSDIHADLRIPSKKHPMGFNNPLFDEIKTKLLGFTSTFAPKDSTSNLTGREKRGKAWLLQMVREEKVFVTKADKGGATLILDHSTVIECVKKDLNTTKNFKKSELSVEEKMSKIKQVIVDKSLDLLDRGLINERDKKLITGLNENNNLVQAPEFRPSVPYTYPLFKIHKLNDEQLRTKEIPPTRLVHATREGPLYRLEKWVKPYLTDISRQFCEEEFLLDTPDLLQSIKELNDSGVNKNFGDNLRLFTLDVIALYPSIDVELALQSLKIALQKSSVNTETGTAVYEFTELILRNAFIGFQGEVYSGKVGIPTGNCVSRQVADNTLHHLLFDKVKPNMTNLWDLITFWKRFIDDVFGLWRGTLRQFDLFVKRLNELAKPFGIQFGDHQIGRSVDYLDVTVYLDEGNQLQYKLFKKETDARMYLKTSSFHPPHVFKSVVYSQMIRVIRRNSLDATCVKDLEQLRSDLAKSGHKEEVMDELEPLAAQRAVEMDLYNNTSQKKSLGEKVVFSVKYFEELSSLRALVNSLKPDIQQLCGEDIQVTFAIRKQPSIANVMVRNRTLSESDATKPTTTKTQKCGNAKCKTCPFLFSASDHISVNGMPVYLDFSLKCNSKNVIYIAQCTICSQGGQKFKDDTYFGQTMTAMNTRMNGHRSHFVIDKRLLFEKSALSMHCFLAHKSDFSMELFKLGIVKQTRAVELNREEERFIQKYRTNICGLNRIAVVR